MNSGNRAALKGHGWRFAAAPNAVGKVRDHMPTIKAVADTIQGSIARVTQDHPLLTGLSPLPYLHTIQVIANAVIDAEMAAFAYAKDTTADCRRSALMPRVHFGRLVPFASGALAE